MNVCEKLIWCFPFKALHRIQGFILPSLIVLLLSIPIESKAQYEPTLVPGRSWHITGFQFNFDLRFPDSLFLNGSVTYQGVEYFVLGSSSDVGYQDTVAYMREDLDGGKVWMRQYNPVYGPTGYISDELLVADYSLEIGDTIRYTFLTYEETDDIVYTVIDTGQVDGRRFVELNNQVNSIFQMHNFGIFGNYSYYAINQLPLRFYEGVGPSHGLLYPLNRNDGYMADPYMHCAYNTGELYFDEPFIIGCTDEFVLSTELLSNSRPYIIYPNPSNDRIYIDFKDVFADTDCLISIYTPDGKKMYEAERNLSTGKIDLSVNEIPAGLYIIRISTKNDLFVEKFLKN
jgi:hypothetical protein